MRYLNNRRSYNGPSPHLSPVRKGPSTGSLPVGVRRTSQPSGRWVDANGNPARSPNEVYDQRESVYATKKEATPVQLPDDPDPNNWTVVRTHQVGSNLVAELKYPNCTNYEGRKILLYKDCDVMKLAKQTHLDPHFLPGQLSPIARFEPTPEGWELAIKTANLI